LILTALSAPPATGQDWARYELDDEILETLSPAMRSELSGLQYLLNARQLFRVVSLDSDELRREWIDRWWRSQDPTPETRLNEMKSEHDRRVKTARIHFGWKEWPGWDHRGEVFIRYGQPEVRRKLEPFVGQAGVIPPGESWHYSRLGMTVLFEDFALSGRYTHAMNSLGNPDKRRVGGGWDREHGTPEGNIAKSIDADFDPPRLDMPPPPVNWYYVHLSKKAQDRIYAYQDVLEKHNAVYPFNFDTRDLPFFFGIGRFKGGGSHNRVDVFVEFPADPEPFSLAGGKRKFTTTAVFFDTDYREIDKRSATIELPPAPDLESAQRWLPAQLVFSLERDYYRMAVTITEEVTGRRSSYRTTIDLEDYADMTAISDILFCNRIVPGETENMFMRGALEVVPHPALDYTVTDKVPIYFELYNLETDDAGLSRYELEYWIVPRDLRKVGLWYQRDETGTYAASRIDGSAHGSDVPVHVTIDTDNLWPGEFEFHVRVTDTRTRFAATRMATFNLVKKD
jgi:GWxTD domain-containing protein